jgi:hypothetical protein
MIPAIRLFILNRTVEHVGTIPFAYFKASSSQKSRRLKNLDFISTTKLTGFAYADLLTGKRAFYNESRTNATMSG